MTKLTHSHTDSHSIIASVLLGVSLVLVPCAVFAAGNPPPTPQAEIEIPNGPVAGYNAHPNTILDLSVEFPTVGAAYRGDYDSRRSYTGYFDPKKCYVYKTFVKRFSPNADADAAHKCLNHYSGNFMNYATMSAIDIMRYAMTGGDRIKEDKNGLTVLQRAFLPFMFYGEKNYFPLRLLLKDGPIKPNEVTPFNKPNLYVISCKNRVLFSDTEPDKNKYNYNNGWELCDKNTNKNTDKNLGELVVQVEVCSDIEGPNRPELCNRFPNGHYKPEGEIQKNSEKMHFSAFGYLLDSTAKRYGGVMRSPIKYVGQKKFDKMLNASVNAEAEWDLQSGTFNPNPSPISGENSSGVINYTNQFGRNGVYKQYDPVSELFYESLRYLQGLDPTDEAIQNVRPEIKDGFPVISKWTGKDKDPILKSCQKNSIILIADARTENDYYIPGNTRAVIPYTVGAGPGQTTIPATAIRTNGGPRSKTADTPTSAALDVMEWTKKIGVIENTVHGIDRTVTPNLAALEKALTGYRESTILPFLGTYYLSGLAYWANTSDLRKGGKGDFTDIHARTYVIDVDEGGNGEINNPSRESGPPRQSQLYLAAKYGGFVPNLKPDGSVIENPYLPQPARKNGLTGCYRYLWDRDGDCNPDNYFLASDGADLVNGVKSIFSQIAINGESVTSVTTSGSVLEASVDQFIYQGHFLKDNAGDLTRIKASVSSESDIVTVSQTEANSAADFLVEPNWPVGSTLPAVPPRRIFTFSPKLDKSTAPFTWESLTATQKTALKGQDSDAVAESRLHYLRGSTNEEFTRQNRTGQFRRRPKTSTGTNVLGDIVNSNPVYVGAPRQDVQGNGYQDFNVANKDRKPAVYVGANDGMLHAFSSDLKSEYFAYIPGIIFSDLKDLSSVNYQHRNYVDGGITVSEAEVGMAWRTVLAATLGGGGQGVFALDVTNPTKADQKDLAIWEFSDADDADMGNIYSPPSIAKFVKGVKNGTPVYEYFVVVSSGINNYAKDDHPSVPATGAKGGALFLLSLNHKANEPWKLNSNYYKFTIPNQPPVDSTAPSGLSPPGFVIGADGAVRFAYAGDLQGRLWRFDFATADKVAAQGADNPKLVFTAQNGNQNQPITAAPVIVFAPAGGYVVLFGTGKFLESKDIATVTQQSFYGLNDMPGSGGSIVRKNELLRREFTGSAGDATLKLQASTPTPSNPKGWYIDFIAVASDTPGERVVTSPLLNYGQVFFNTLLPSIDACHPVSGGRSYVVNSLTGLPTEDSSDKTGLLSTLGALSTPISFDIKNANSDGAQTFATGKKSSVRKYSVVNFGTKGVVPPTSRIVTVPAGRLSWREIFNYQELHNAP